MFLVRLSGVRHQLRLHQRHRESQRDGGRQGLSDGLRLQKRVQVLDPLQGHQRVQPEGGLHIESGNRTFNGGTFP